MRTHQIRRRLGFAALLAASAACGTNDADKQPDSARVEAAVDEARRAADRLGQQLMTALAEALGKSGPVGAIEVCQLRAPQIAEQLSRSGKLEIGRTALRLRNPNNGPDEREKLALEQFAGDLAGGAGPASLEVHKVEATSDGWRVRWMRPIVLQPMCVICHGDELEPDLRTELAKRYPQDQATGFQPGELRGAFTASVSVQQ